MGLVQRLTEPGLLEDAAREYVRKLAESTSPAAMAETKRLVYRHLGTGYVEALHEAETSETRFVKRADASEGARAFIEKRAPAFARLGDE
jgi:enoyl-CoA hydratase/carnithine racemase